MQQFDQGAYGGQGRTMSAATEPVRLDWQRPERMAGLGLWNFFMRIVTIGIHQFWGKAEIRRRLWSSIRLNGEPLTYTGTGWELFRGFLFTVLLFFVPFLLIVVAAQIAFSDRPAVLSALLFASYIPFIFLFFVGFYSAQRYRLSRTEWRGIRGSLDGGAWGYAWHCFWTALLIPLTLGWIWPWRSVFLQRKLVDNMRFGDRPFRFDAPVSPLYGRYAMLWVLGILITVGFLAAIAALWIATGLPVPSAGGEPSEPGGIDPRKISILGYQVLGLYLLYIVLMTIAGGWYQAFKFNHFAKHTSFEGATFSARVTGLGLIWQSLSSAFIILFTLGILTPVALARLMGYRISRTELTGAVPVDSILQSGSAASTSGEGLAQYFDIDVF